MSKRVALPAAIKALRETKAGQYDPQTRQWETPQFGTSAFAIACLLSPAHLCNIEAGRKSATDDVIERIAAQLGVSVDAISYVNERENAA